MKCRTLLIGAISLGLVAGLTACDPEADATKKDNGDSQQLADDAMDESDVEVDEEAVALLPDEVKERGTLRSALDLHYPPTSFKNAGSNEALGFNPDFTRLLGARLGLDVEFSNVTFDTIITGIEAGRYDISAHNFTATPERLEAVDMVSYWNSGSSLVVLAGNPENLDANDLSLCGKTVAVHKGSTQADKHLPDINDKCEEAGEPPVDDVLLPEVQSSLTQLVSKRIDAVFADTPQLAWAAAEQPDEFELLNPQYKKKDGNNVVSLALPKDSELTEAVEVATRNLVGTEDYTEALSRWGLESGAIDPSEVAKQ
ncbi:amino acid ABC transporter substrate-binding protein (PAAT family) [Brevibacterium sanguinis]|uniref:Amino acid ABC transporter substrate-binding protein (PAAT family) n=2 Tax=Brevibacterium TaxID=1696 RepID=A0A366IGP0_9MICO|nr:MULTISPECIES: ABC transporter substrate-binding protein [Brevibacterium]RBP62964.1 amino acid ABC transporter substrate-binding protein (PAAT family) [Brevibacterium sanguinis]RBP69491.1 amino acid ABC transporter substrate-binding protein (PAAT family) [Brevibacterium celere]